MLGGAQVPVGQLGELLADVATIHGQSEQIRLGTPERQREVLDAHGGQALGETLAAYRQAFEARREARAELANLRRSAQERNREIDLLTFGLLYVLISMLFWHAPALIGWHKVPMKQALFYSMVACWRNKWAFMLYGISWAAIFFGVQMAGVFLTILGLSPGIVQLLMTPVNIAIAAVLYASFYPAYVSVFRSDA